MSTGASLAQERPTGLEIAGLPALDYNSDEGLGYGALGEAYHYGDGRTLPYVWTMQAKVFLTTRGRRDVSIFFDAPGVIARGWRLIGNVAYEKRVETPFYGLGNASVRDPALEDPTGPDPDYYSFGRRRRIARVDLQRSLGASPVRVLLGMGLSSTEVDPVPNDVGSTLYAQLIGADTETLWTNFVRAGVVWDSRDRESSTRRGVWSEVLVQWVDEQLGADVGFTRWTLIDRRYFPLHDRLVLANRMLLQGVSGEAPIEQQQRFETSYKDGEGLGGSSSVRGVTRNRYAGKGLFLLNTELRLRLVDFSLLSRDFHLAASAFLDQGRVWSGAPRIGEALSDLHRGYGGGLHGGMGESFVASLNAGTSAGNGLKIYLGLGYLF